MIGPTQPGRRKPEMNILRRVLLKRSVVVVVALLFLTTVKSYPTSMGEAQYVDVDGIRTRYFEGGRGEAMLLVHGGGIGGGISAVGWMPIFPSLAEHFHVYAIDKLGCGLTENPTSDEDYKMRATVRHLYRFLDTMGIDQVHLVGHSRGGLPVARIAMDHPERVKTLTLFDSDTLAPGDPVRQPRELGPPGPPPTAESLRERVLSNETTFHTDFLTDELLEAQLEVALNPKIREGAERMEMLRRRFIEDEPEKVKARPGLANNSGTAWWLYETKDETLDMLRAGRLQTPTHLIWGFNDPRATYKLGMDLFLLISESIDRAQIDFLNKSGHYPWQEYPQEVIDLMLSFIESVKD
jgi:2-hydroxy-6-oxo-6-(2'-carboxyphenyl)-hexa-2,4-dienoate hydrolase